MILAVMLILVILGYLGNMVIAWQSVPKRNRLTRMALFFVMLGVGGAIGITIDTSNTSDELLARTDENSALSKKLAEFQSESKVQVKQTSDILIKYSEQLLNKTDENTDLTKKLAESQVVMVALIHDNLKLSKGNNNRLNSNANKLNNIVDALERKGIINRKVAENLKEEIKNAKVTLPPLGSTGDIGNIPVPNIKR